MDVVRNIQVKLDVHGGGHELLDETFEQFRQVAQHVADHGWDDNPYNITDTKNTSTTRRIESSGRLSWRVSSTVSSGMWNHD